MHTHERDPTDAMRFARWRKLGAIGKADHVLTLCARVGLRPARTLEIGCGDGALLCELRAREFGGRLEGVEITQAAVEIARGRVEIDAVELYDGAHLPAGEGDYELGIVSHVLEHVPDPTALLAEAARACGAVVMEVPLEANLSARRASKREHASEVGHLQRLDRTAARAIVARPACAWRASWRIRCRCPRTRSSPRPPRHGRGRARSGHCAPACTVSRPDSPGGCLRCTTRVCACRPSDRGEQQRQHASHQVVGNRVGVGELLPGDTVGERVDRER